MEANESYLDLANAIKDAPSIPPCMQTDPEVFFSTGEDAPSTWAVAKKMCATCPVIKECATYAIVAAEPHGVWGGLTPMQRRAIRLGRFSGSPQRLAGLVEQLAPQQKQVQPSR